MSPQTQVERRPTPMTRRPDDGLGKAVTKIIPPAAVLATGCALVALPIAFGTAGDGFWPLVVAYGGCLVGFAVGGAVKR